MTTLGLEQVRVGFYDPAERARRKADQRRQDEQDVKAGHLQIVERRNHWLGKPATRPGVAWEVEPLLE